MFTKYRKRSLAAVDVAAPSQPNRRPRRRGVAASELAVCLPVIVLLVLATIEACSMVFLKQSLTVASYEGVRMALDKGATSAEVQVACQQVLADRKVDGATVTVKPANITPLKPGDMIDVVVTAPCGQNSVLPIMFYKGKTLSSTASMMKEF